MKIRRLLIAPVIALLTLGFVVDAHAAAIAPTDVTVTNASVADTAINAAAVSVKWSATAGSIAYQVETSKDSISVKLETVNFVSGLTSGFVVVSGLVTPLSFLSCFFFFYLITIIFFCFKQQFLIRFRSQTTSIIN